MNRINKWLLICLPAILLLVADTSCKKTKRPELGDYPKDDQVLPPGDLRFYVPFDMPGNELRFKAADSISTNPSFFSPKPFSLVQGTKGQGLKGTDQAALLYLNANDFAKAKSFTIALWEKNTVPTGGSPQWIFSLPDKDYWHNSGMFLFVDHDAAGSTTSQAVVKLAVEDHWFEFTPANGRMPGNLLDNNWHHLAIVYNETTSKMTYYVDGQQLTGLTPAVTDWKDGANPHGPMNLNPASVSNFILGGWNKHAAVAGPTDAWIQSWQGSLDQFRLYNKALSASDIQALYNSRL